MNTILVWVLVISATTYESPSISLPVADLASCQRMQEAIVGDSFRKTRCVEVRVIK